SEPGPSKRGMVIPEISGRARDCLGPLPGAPRTPSRERGEPATDRDRKESPMRSVSWRTACALVIGGAGLLGCREAAAQSLGAASNTGALSPGVPATSGGGPLSATMAPSATVNPIAPAIGSATQGGVFSNPLTAPFLYNSMLPASQPQSPANALYGPT